MFVRHRMHETQPRGMKRLPGKCIGTSCGLTGGPFRKPPTTAIDRIADQRVPGMCHVNADLVGPSRFEPAPDKRGVRSEAFDDLDPGDGVPTAIEMDRLALSVRPMTVEPGCDLDDGSRFEADAADARKPGFGRVRNPVAEREIGAIHAVCLELGGETVVGRV